VDPDILSNPNPNSVILTALMVRDHIRYHAQAELGDAFYAIEDRAIEHAMELVSDGFDEEFDAELDLIKEHLLVPIVDAAIITTIKQALVGPPIDMLFFVGDQHRKNVERYFLRRHPDTFEFLYRRKASDGPLALTRM
jgi:hypothetical protein